MVFVKLGAWGFSDSWKFMPWNKTTASQSFWTTRIQNMCDIILARNLRWVSSMVSFNPNWPPRNLEQNSTPWWAGLRMESFCCHDFSYQILVDILSHSHDKNRLNIQTKGWSNWHSFKSPRIQLWIRKVFSALTVVLPRIELHVT